MRYLLCFSPIYANNKHDSLIFTKCKHVLQLTMEMTVLNEKEKGRWYKGEMTEGTSNGIQVGRTAFPSESTQTRRASSVWSPPDITTSEGTHAYCQILLSITSSLVA